MQIFRYIRGILVYGICFWHGEEGTLQGYIDVEWVRECECQRFTFDYIFILGMSLISWSAKKQHSIATSSTKMEYQVMIETSKKNHVIKIYVAQRHIFNQVVV
jgi:hypothetical protein